MAALNIEDPLSDLTRNSNAGDTRFIGIAGFACHAPGVEDGDADLVWAHGMNCLAGTSDVIESRTHLKMIEEATEYARHYNRALAVRLREMAAP